MDDTAKAKLWMRVRAAAGGGLMAVLAVVTPYFEGTRSLPYRDVVGMLTVCQGHTGSDIIEGKRYTPEECARLFAGDAGRAVRAVQSGITVRLGLYTQVALVDFTFNVGAGAFMGSTLRRRLNAGEGAPACDEFLKWTRAGLVHPQGLKDRREFERELCIQGFKV